MIGTVFSPVFILSVLSHGQDGVLSLEFPSQAMQRKPSQGPNDGAEQREKTSESITSNISFQRGKP